MKLQNFGTFDGLDNRKELVRMFDRLLHKTSPEEGKAKVACFIQALVGMGNKFSKRAVVTSAPQNTYEAYAMFAGICGNPAFGLDITKAAQVLEKVVRKQ